MKNKVLQKILTYIGVAFLGALVGAGALVGISSCASQYEARAETTIKEKATPKMAQLSSSDTFDSDKTYYFEAKNYSTNGEGVFYDVSINLTNSAVVNTDEPSVYMTFDLINGSTAQFSRLFFVSELEGGIYHLSFVRLANDSFRVSIYSALSGSFNRSYCAFVGTNFSSIGPSGYWYIYKFFNVYELQSDTYTLNDNINPYTWWNTAMNSPYVSYITFESGQVAPIKTIKMPNFYVGGLAFDSIRFSYANVTSGEHFNVNGEQFVYAGNDYEYMTFIYASYYNSATQYELAFYKQEITYGAYGYNGYTYQCAFNWSNLDLKTIQFFERPSQSVLNSLNELNNNYQSVGYSTTTTDIGLGNAFSLLGLAFSSLTSLFSIQVLPGISLGLLLFLPLIAGIIIAVIWVVKR